MKRTILLLFLLGSAVFAAAEKVDVKAECAKGCCKDYGSWDGTTCRQITDQESYDACTQTCEQFAGGSLSCCGAGFILMAVPLIVLMRAE